MPTAPTPIAFSAARAEVDGPAITPAQRGFLRLAEVRDVSGGNHELIGVEYLSDACAEGGIWNDLCKSVSGVFCGTVSDPTEVKTFEAPEHIVSYDPFSIYGGTECRGDDDASRARRRQELVEGYRFDEEFLKQINTGSDIVDITPTPGTPLDVTVAVGMLEDYAAGAYWGVPNILAYSSTTVCADAAGIVERDQLNGDIHTINGSQWASLHTPSTGIPDPKYLYVFGAILVQRGPVLDFLAPETVRPDGTCDPARQLAERVYVPTIECLAARVEVNC